MPEKITSQQQSAKHLAARAVMAYRAGFPVTLLSVTRSSERPSGIVFDWKSQRDSFQNDAKLLGRAFAFVYVGSIVDQVISDPTFAQMFSQASQHLGQRTVYLEPRNSSH